MKMWRERVVRDLTHLMSDVLSGSVEEAHVHNHSLLDLRTEKIRLVTPEL